MGDFGDFGEVGAPDGFLTAGAATPVAGGEVLSSCIIDRRGLFTEDAAEERRLLFGVEGPGDPEDTVVVVVLGKLRELGDDGKPLSVPSCPLPSPFPFPFPFPLLWWLERCGR